jgi:hypothetical protein
VESVTLRQCYGAMPRFIESPHKSPHSRARSPLRLILATLTPNLALVSSALHCALPQIFTRMILSKLWYYPMHAVYFAYRIPCSLSPCRSSPSRILARSRFSKPQVSECSPEA